MINANGTHSLTINTGTQSVINAGLIESTAAGGLNIFSNVDNAGGNLRLYMAQLRRKLEPDPARPRWLITEPGMGYRYQPSPDEDPVSP